MKKKELISLGIIGLTTIATACLIGCEASDYALHDIVLTEETQTITYVYEDDTLVSQSSSESTTSQSLLVPKEDGTLEEVEKPEVDGLNFEEKEIETEESKETEETAENTDSSTYYGDTNVDLSTLTKVTVERVVDGDTYLVDLDGEKTKVRLIGVDTPESVAPQSYTESSGKENTEVGEYISSIMKDTIKSGDTLYLEFDVNQYDKYDRVLAYAYFEDGEMVQEFLLNNGLAQVMTIEPNVKYSDRFVELEQKAIENGIGIWDYSINTITKESLESNLSRGRER